MAEQMENGVSKIQEIFYELRVREVMTRDVITVTPQTTMRELQEILRVHRISGTPVLSGSKLIGIASLMDLIQALERGQIDAAVQEWMTEQVDVLYGDERVVSAIRKLQSFGYGRFPVIDRGTEKLIGILTQGDIIKGTLKQLDIDYRRREQDSERESRFFDDITSDDTRIVLNYAVQALDFMHGGEASSQFKRSLQVLGFSPAILRRIAVATYEAETNLILHTTDGGTIEAQVRADVICIEVCDHGPGIPDVEQAMKPGFSTAPSWIREMGFGAGMGLQNIKNCADEMSLTSEVPTGTRLQMSFYVDRQSEGES
jgi:CBS domain-containing protein/anti-sigma regulatory factor (Ser/Thr protein kinase)